MKLSTRNQLPGTVTSITTGEAMAVVRIKLDGGPEITSSITRDAVEDLESRRGQQGHRAGQGHRGLARRRVTLCGRSLRQSLGSTGPERSVHASTRAEPRGRPAHRVDYGHQTERDGRDDCDQHQELDQQVWLHDRQDESAGEEHGDGCQAFFISVYFCDDRGAGMKFRTARACAPPRARCRRRSARGPRRRPRGAARSSAPRGAWRSRRGRA